MNFILLSLKFSSGSLLFWFHESIYCHITHLQNIFAYSNIKSLSTVHSLEFVQWTSRSHCSISACESSMTLYGLPPRDTLLSMKSYAPVGPSISLVSSPSSSWFLFHLSAMEAAGESILLTAHLWAHFCNYFVLHFFKAFTLQGGNCCG